MNKPIVFGLAIVVLALVGGGVFWLSNSSTTVEIPTPTPTPSPQPTEELIVYENSDLGIRFSYPKDWGVSYIQDDGLLYVATKEELENRTGSGGSDVPFPIHIRKAEEKYSDQSTSSKKVSKLQDLIVDDQLTSQYREEFFGGELSINPRIITPLENDAKFLEVSLWNAQSVHARNVYDLILGNLEFMN